jgi:aryl-alcohol dehydrogenase-like predicted oxidoreductase
MHYRQLGDSNLHISEICLGTMTFGRQNSMEDAHQQLDCALDCGVNFIDTAEMYPVPAQAETQGLTEEFIGSWLVKRQRDRLTVATKIAGPSRRMDWIRNGPIAVDKANIEQAVNDSLKLLQTDYIDLYQIHWPDRYVPLFGQTRFDPKQIRDTIPIAEQLAVFAELITAGKIRSLGLSNETPWGVSQFCQVARQLGLPKVVSIQNAYNLINRTFEVALAETCHHENLGLLAYSPLGFGSLSGKYDQTNLANGRLTLFPGFGQRYYKPNVHEAVAEYVAIARKHNLSPVAMALAFVRQRWFVTSTIIGATTLEQLKENLASVNIILAEEILDEIDAVHTRYPSPAP